MSVSEHGDQALAPAGALRQQALAGSGAVVAVGRVDVAGKNASLHIGDNLPFAPVNVLAAVGAPVLKNARGQLDALAVYAHKRRRCGPVGCQPVGPVQDLVEAGPYGRLPAPEIVVHGCPGRESSGQGPPLTAGAADVAHGVDYAPPAQAPVAVHGQ